MNAINPISKHQNRFASWRKYLMVLHVAGIRPCNRSVQLVILTSYLRLTFNIHEHYHTVTLLQDGSQGIFQWPWAIRWLYALRLQYLKRKSLRVGSNRKQSTALISKNLASSHTGDLARVSPERSDHKMKQFGVHTAILKRVKKGVR